MNLQRTVAGMLAAAALFAGPAARAEAPPGTARVTLGNESILIPVPQAFGDPTDTPAMLSELAGKALPATNRFVGVLLPQDYLDALRAAKPQRHLSRYFLLQTLRDAEATGVPPAVFDLVKAQFRENADAVFAQVKDEARKNIDRAAKAVGDITGDKTLAFDAGTPKSLGILEESADSITLATVQPVSATAQAGTRKFNQVMAMTFVLVHRKPLLATVYSDYDSQSDIDWAEGQILD